MKKLAILFVLLCGCSKPKELPKAIVTHDGNQTTIKCPQGEICQAPDPVSLLTDEEKIALLRKEAHTRHLRWRIFCVDSAGFQGWAVQPGDDFQIYIEEGAKPNWSSQQRSQADTAYELYLLIQGEPNVKPEHRLSAKKRFCPPELRSE